VQVLYFSPINPLCKGYFDFAKAASLITAAVVLEGWSKKLIVKEIIISDYPFGKPIEVLTLRGQTTKVKIKLYT
jgi:hypothetical protein